MPTSNRYISLAARVTQLESHLLPGIDPTLSYTEKDRDLTRAYYLLCHAEFEAYIEDITKEVTIRAFTKWNADKSIISPIIFHLAYNYRQEQGKPKDAPYSMIVKSYNSLIKVIDKSNGIKEDNLNNFFKPIGFEIDPTLQSTLNDFGRTRGQIAHTAFHTQQPLDPSTEKNHIKQILSALSLFDQELNDYEINGTLNRTPINMRWTSRFPFLDRAKKWLRI
jgi:hypothetical protein